MTIKTSGWTAQIDRMPGAASFRTLGTVEVSNSGITPKLVLSVKQDKSFDLRLDLVLEQSDDAALQVITQKQVEYTVLGNSNVTGVSIFFNDELIHHIDEVLITH